MTMSKLHTQKSTAALRVASALSDFSSSATPVHLGRMLRTGNHLQQSPLVSQDSSNNNERHLNSFDASPLSASGTIAWLCFVSLCVVTPIACCALFYALRIHRQQAEQWNAIRAEEEEQANTDISRIQANVKTFTDIEDKSRRRSIQRTHRKNIRIVLEEDLYFSSKSALNDDDDDDDDIEAGSVQDSDTLRTEDSVYTNTISEKSHFTAELSSGCSICLESFAAGDAVMHSTDVQECRHVFHKECIVSWLAAQSTSACPCCRQEFIGGGGTPENSLSTQEQFQEGMGGGVLSAATAVQVQEIEAIVPSQDRIRHERDGNDDEIIRI